MHHVDQCFLAELRQSLGVKFVGYLVVFHERQNEALRQGSLRPEIDGRLSGTHESDVFGIHSHGSRNGFVRVEFVVRLPNRTNGKDDDFAQLMYIKLLIRIAR